MSRNLGITEHRNLEGERAIGLPCKGRKRNASLTTRAQDKKMSKYNLDEIDEDKRDSGISKGEEAHMDEWRGRRGTQMQARLCGLA